MTKRKKSFPGVTPASDRHGKVRWRLRRRIKGVAIDTYIHGKFGSDQFRAEYEAALDGAKAPARRDGAKPGTLKWVGEQYLRSPRYLGSSDSWKATVRGQLDWLFDQAGDLPIDQLQTKHVEALMGAKYEEGSGQQAAAANTVKKNLSILFNYAMKKGYGATFNPAAHADGYKENPDGFHTWTIDEMRRFLTAHAPGTKARLVFALAANTGAARQDIAAMTWGNIEGDEISYKRGKTKIGGTFPIFDLLRNELVVIPRGTVVLVTHGKRGLPYKPETLGNWFKEQCKAAGLPHCSLHGIRKGIATQIADHGGTEYEVMAFLAHATPKQGATYTKQANRKTLIGSGLKRLDGGKPEQKLSNLIEKLDKSGGK